MATAMKARESWTDYVERILAGISRKEAARQANISEATLSRWINPADGKRPLAENVISLAKAFHQEPVKALIAAGYLTPDDIPGGVIEIYQARAELSDDELIAELRSRLAERPQRDRVDDITRGLTLGNDAS